MTHLHKYRIVEEYPDALLEICTECGHRLVTRIPKEGKFDNKRYRESHRRDFLQPSDKEFKKYYGIKI